MIKAGYQVVAYDFNIAVGKESPQKSIEVLNRVYQDVARRTISYKENNVSDISSFGVSMGTVFAGYTGAHIAEIKNVILNLPYGDIVGHIISFSGMRSLPKSAVNQYIASAGGKEKLAGLMKEYSPVAYADKLSKKRVLLYTARKDGVLEYGNTIQLKNLLNKHHTALTYIENKTFGHYLSALTNNLRGSIYMSFLKGNK
jgi:predicted esterase